MNTIERAVIVSEHPMQTALAFQLRLALEKGYTSTVRPDGGDVLIVASDGQAVRFAKESK